MGADKKKSADPLRIQIGGIESRQQKPLNRVTTTKYTWFTFLPLNFYEQFRRAVYFYFLIITIVSFFVSKYVYSSKIGQFSMVDPLTNRRNDIAIGFPATPTLCNDHYGSKGGIGRLLEIEK